MASTGADVDYSLLDGRGPPTFRIRGKVFHQIGSLLPTPGNVPKFSQIYINQSGAAQLDRRMSIFSGMNREILSHLQSTLHDINPYVQQFKAAGEAVEGGAEVELIIRADTGDVDRRRYNLPTTAGEVAALLPGEPVAAPRDIIIQTRHGQLQRIAESNAAYEPLHFPLMLPFGDTGWHLGIPHTQNAMPNPVLLSIKKVEQLLVWL